MSGVNHAFAQNMYITQFILFYRTLPLDATERCQTQRGLTLASCAGVRVPGPTEALGIFAGQQSAAVVTSSQAGALVSPAHVTRTRVQCCKVNQYVEVHYKRKYKEKKSKQIQMYFLNFFFIQKY